MKKIKMLKWKIGIAGALGLTVLFNTVKTSPEFHQAYVKASTAFANSSPSIAEPKDPLNDKSLAPFTQRKTPRYHSKTRRS